MSPPDAERGPGKALVQGVAHHDHRYSERSGQPVHEVLSLAGLSPAPACVVCHRAPCENEVDGVRVHNACRPHTYATAPATSWTAGAGVKRGRSSLLARRILELLREQGPMTDFEIASLITEAPYGSCSKRRLDLVRDGFVEDTGTTRPTRTGNAAIVWRAAP